jgi:hypothetical protein
MYTSSFGGVVKVVSVLVPPREFVPQSHSRHRL